MKAVIFLCDLTGISAKPWIGAGYTCFSFDVQYEQRKDVMEREHNWYTCREPIGTSQFYEILDGIRADYVVKFAGAFPPCTDLAVSGAAHFANKRRKDPDFQLKAMRFFAECETICKWLDVPYFIENPVSVISTMYRKPNYSFHPYEYSGYLDAEDIHPLYPEYIAPRDMYPKKTCLWTGGGFKMPEKVYESKPDGLSSQHLKLGGKSLKTKNIRSATPRGFSLAVFEANK